MLADDFNTVVSQRCEKIFRVLAVKAREYATTDDRFHNFKVAASLDGETPERALWGMLKKHLVSVRDMVDGLGAMDCPEYSLWDEKLGDFINYLVLLEGLIVERVNNGFDSKVQNEFHSQPVACCCEKPDVFKQWNEG